MDPSKILHRAKDRVPNLVGVKHTSKEVRKVYNSSLVDSSRFQVLMGTEAVSIHSKSEFLYQPWWLSGILKSWLLFIILSYTCIFLKSSNQCYNLILNFRNSYLIFLLALIFRWLCHTWELYSTNWKRHMILETKTQHWKFK